MAESLIFWTNNDRPIARENLCNNNQQRESFKAATFIVTYYYYYYYYYCAMDVCNWYNHTDYKMSNDMESTGKPLLFFVT